MSVVSDMEGAGVYAKDIEGWIAGSEIVRSAKKAKAEEVAEYWKSIAPVYGDKPPKHNPPTIDWPHEYADSIKVVDDHGTVSVGTDLTPLADWLEYGSEHNPEHGYGARTLAHFGGGPVDAAAKLTDKLFIG